MNVRPVLRRGLKADATRSTRKPPLAEIPSPQPGACCLRLPDVHFAEPGPARFWKPIPNAANGTFVLRIFQHEVELQCKFIVTAAHELNAALVVGNTDEIWKQLQIILVASANLSKMFWGSSGKREAERARLRESLQVDDTSPLRDPDLRNDFEHFDERLEQWFTESEHKNYVGRNIGPPGMIVGIDQSERFQQFDPETTVVTFWDHSVSLNEIVNEAARILPLARAEARKPHWDEN